MIETTIASGASTSAEIDLGNVPNKPETPISPALLLVDPNGFTGTAVTFTVDIGDGTFRTLKDDAGADVSVTVASGNVYVLPPDTFGSVSKFKIVSNGTEGAERTLTVVPRVHV